MTSIGKSREGKGGEGSSRVARTIRQGGQGVNIF